MKVKGKEWTTEGRIIAALVNRLGGEVTLHSFELENVEGLMMANLENGRVKLEATEAEPTPPSAHLYISPN